MASHSIQAVGHRARQALRPRYELAETPEGKVLTNPCDWLHDTVVTNRAEKRRALALAKKYRCSEESKPDEKRGTETTWVHGKRCPKYEPPDNKADPTSAAEIEARIMAGAGVDVQPPVRPAAA